MLHQDEPSRERGAFDQRYLVDEFTDRVTLVDTVGDHLAVGHTAHARLIEKCRRALVEMHTTMPQTILTGRVVAARRIGHVGQELQGITVRLLAREGKSPVDRSAFGHVRYVLFIGLPLGKPVLVLAGKIE